MDNKLIDKIQKLLSLATSPNEAEARAAAEKANELMIKYNIHLSQLSQISGDEYERRGVFEADRIPSEALWVMGIVKDHFFVRTIYTPSTRARRTKWGLDSRYRKPGTVWFVGEKTNVQVAEYIFTFLVQKYRELWKVHKAEKNAHDRSRPSFYNGITQGLNIQLTKKRKQVEQANALVLVEDPNVKKLFEKEFPETRKTDHYADRDKDPNAFVAGVEQGKKLNIHRGVEHNAGNRGLSLEKK